MNSLRSILEEEYGKKFDSFKILKMEDFWIQFRLWGFTIKIIFMKNITEDLARIQWYYIFFNEEKQKEQSLLILEHYFDSLGRIYKEKSKQDPHLWFFRRNGEIFL